jgi:cytochrome c
MGPDGKMYILEYGTSDGWFKKNKDAGISRIEYNAGNRAPEIAAISADKTYGALPLKVKLSVKATDPEKDKLSYNWNFGNGIKKVTAVPTVAYTYTKKAEYKPTVTVKDTKLASATSKPVYIAAGSLEEPIDPSLPFAAGKALMMSLDCKACHNTEAVSVGPSFTQVANKYNKNKATYSTLTSKIQNGGTGVWGDVVMPAHPSLKSEEISQILDWVFSLKAKK